MFKTLPRQAYHNETQQNYILYHPQIYTQKNTKFISNQTKNQNINHMTL